MNRRMLDLLILIALWVFIFLFVLQVGSRGNQIFLPAPPGTAAVVFLDGKTHSIASPKPEDVEQALKESEPSVWIGVGKYISVGNAAAATFFTGLSMGIPSCPEPCLIGKGGAKMIAYICSAISVGVGSIAVYTDHRRPKLSWEEAKFFLLYPEEQVEVLKFPDGNVGVMIIEGKFEKYFIAEGKKFLVISKEETDLPHHTLLDAQILYFKERPMLPSRELKREEFLRIDEETLKTKLVIY